MLFILMGEDDFSRRQSLEEIKRGLGDEVLLATNTTTLDGQQVTPDELGAVCGTVPFLAEKRLVIVEGLLERFEPADRPSRTKKTTRVTNHHSECDSFSTYIREMPESTILVLIERKVRSSNPLLKEMAVKAQVKSFPLLRGTELRQWIQRRVTEVGGRISSQAIELLAKFVGSDLWLMTNEINKLVLFSSGRPIEEEDVALMVSQAQEASVFAMVDAILESRTGVAQQLLQQLLQRGASPAYIMVMLARQVHLVVRARELKSQGKSEAEMRNKLGLTSEFALRKALEQAGRYPLARLKEIYHQLLETDLSIKTGKLDGELALGILVAALRH